MIFRLLIPLLGLLFLSQANAQSSWKHAIYGGMSFDRAGFGLGVDYENRWHRTYGVGAYFKMQQKKEGKQNGITLVGAHVRPHFLRRRWDLYVSPGFGMVMYSPAGANADAVSSFGPSMMMGIMYQWDASLSFGMDRTTAYMWFEEDYAGRVYDDLKVTARYKF